MEASEETAVEASEEAVVEASEEAVMESSEETAVESSEETALEVLKEAALESSEEAVLESSEDTALEASKESEVEALEEVDRIIKHSSAIDDQEEAIVAAAAAVEAENAHLPPSAVLELARNRFQKTKCPPPETGNVLEPRLSFSTLRSVLATMAAMPDGALLESGLDEEEDLVLLNNSVTKLVWSNDNFLKVILLLSSTSPLEANGELTVQEGNDQVGLPNSTMQYLTSFSIESNSPTTNSPTSPPTNVPRLPPLISTPALIRPMTSSSPSSHLRRHLPTGITSSFWTSFHRVHRTIAPPPRFLTLA